MYAEEWQGWDDFLGVILPYSQAHMLAAMQLSNLHTPGPLGLSHVGLEKPRRLVHLRRIRLSPLRGTKLQPVDNWMIIG